MNGTITRRQQPVDSATKSHEPRASDDVRNELEQLYERVSNSAVAHRGWQRLTDDERQRVGNDFASARRQYRVTAMWAMARGMSADEAVLDLAYHTDLLPPKKYEWLLRELRLTVPREKESPSWNRDKLELSFEGKVVRRIRGAKVAKNVVAVLDAFQSLGWPDRIDDPLDGGREAQRLHQTILSLNRRLKGISFHGDGSARGIVWRRRPQRHRQATSN